MYVALTSEKADCSKQRTISLQTGVCNYRDNNVNKQKKDKFNEKYRFCKEKTQP